MNNSVVSRNRSFLIILLTFFSLPICAQQLSEIKGKVTSKRFQKLCLYRVVNGRPDTLGTIIPSADGSFGFMFKVTESAFYAIGNQFRTFRLYLKPGDKANVTINDSLVAFDGPNTKENIALGKWENIICRLREMTVYFMESSSTYKEMFPELVTVNEKANKFLEHSKTGISLFDALLEQTVAFDMDYCSIMSVFTPRRIHPKKEEYPSPITNVLKSKLYLNDDVLKQPFGSALVNRVSMFKISQAGNPLAFGDFDTILGTVSGTLAKGELIIERALRIDSYAKYADFEKKYGHMIVDADQKERLELIRLKLIDYKEGAPAYNFTYPDMEGKMVSLTDFKGKVVLVDVWATWCGPCKREIPSLKKLEADLHGKDVVVVSVSLDVKKDFDKWKTFVKDNELTGVHLFADGWSKIVKDYKIKGIPRFMLFDKNGNIVKVDAPRPSEPALKEMILQQLAK